MLENMLNNVFIMNPAMAIGIRIGNMIGKKGRAIVNKMIAKMMMPIILKMLVISLTFNSFCDIG